MSDCSSASYGVSGYSVQTFIAAALFILGLILLIIWAILYANRLANNLNPEWWIWFFLGFGLALLVVGLIWLMLVQFAVGRKIEESYCRYFGQTRKELESKLRAAEAQQQYEELRPEREAALTGTAILSSNPGQGFSRVSDPEITQRKTSPLVRSTETMRLNRLSSG